MILIAILVEVGGLSSWVAVVVVFGADVSAGVGAAVIVVGASLVIAEHAMAITPRNSKVRIGNCIVQKMEKAMT